MGWSRQEKEKEGGKIRRRWRRRLQIREIALRWEM
jgi:hypothetical protein